MAGRDEAVVRALPLNDAWVGYGVDERVGVTVEGLKLGADDWGPHDIAFTMKRDPGVTFADLQAATPLEVEIGGLLLSSGRISQTPTSEVNRQISVNGQGWQFHLDDDDYQKTYVHSALTDFVDVRGLPSAQLGTGAGNHPASCQVQAGSDGITLTFPGDPTNPQTVGQFEGCSVQLDLGPLNTAVRIVADVQTSNNDGNTTLFCFVGNDPRPQQGTFTTAFSQPLNVASATLAGTVTAQRYVSFRLQRQGVAVAPGADEWVKITRILVFTSTGYESGNASILKASTVIGDALAKAPLLTQSTKLVTATSFNIPDLVATRAQTPRDYMNAVNAYHSFQIRVNADKTLEYRARPTTPLLTNFLGTFEDQSSGSLDQVFNKCVGNATGPDGSILVSTQFASPATTIPDRRGYFKANALDTNMSLTQAALDQLCQTFLASHRSMPFKGTLTVVGWDSVRMTNGNASVPAWELLRYVGEMIHFPNLVDPDTGAKGRDGRISAVSYDHDTRTASVSIDSQRANFEALLARLQVVTGRVS